MPEIDFNKFKEYYSQLSDIQMVVDKLVTKQNASVYNKVGTKTEILFNSIKAINLRQAPVEDIRTIIDLLKKLRETCLTLSSYKKYLESIIPKTVEDLSQAVEEPQVEAGKKLELKQVEGNVA